GTSLAVTAGLGIRSINNLQAIDPGFRPEGVMISSLDLSSLSPQRRAGFLSQLQNELPRLAGVASVSLAAEAPTGARRMRKIRQADEQTTIDAELSYVGADYFKTIGTPILQGEEFVLQQDNSRAVIVNDVIAVRYWPGQVGVGKRLRVQGETADREVRAV